MMFRLFAVIFFCFYQQQSVFAFFRLYKDDYGNQPQGIFDDQYQNASQNRHSNQEDTNPYTQNFYNAPVTNQETHTMTPSVKHLQYTPMQQEMEIPNAPYLPDSGRRAKPAEIAYIKRYYRHVNVHDKIPAQNFFNVHIIYAPPIMVYNFGTKLNYANRFEQEVINKFISQYKENVNSSGDLVMDNMNFGLMLGYGTRKSYDIFTEWQVFFCQGRYASDEKFKGADTNFLVEYTEGENDVSISYQNVEFLQRTIGLHYNVYKEFVDLLKDSPNTTIRKTVPYFMVGGGVASQFELLRLSSGGLGMGGFTGGRTTKQNYFNISPSFGAALGSRYKITEEFSADFRVATIQVIPNINMRNFNVQMGLRFYL